MLLLACASDCDADAANRNTRQTATTEIKTRGERIAYIDLPRYSRIISTSQLKSVTLQVSEACRLRRRADCCVRCRLCSRRLHSLQRTQHICELPQAVRNQEERRPEQLQKTENHW